MNQTNKIHARKICVAEGQEIQNKFGLVETLCGNVVRLEQTKPHREDPAVNCLLCLVQAGQQYKLRSRLLQQQSDTYVAGSQSHESSEPSVP